MDSTDLPVLRTTIDSLRGGGRAAPELSILAEITATSRQVPVVQRRDALPAASA